MGFHIDLNIKILHEHVFQLSFQLNTCIIIIKAGASFGTPSFDVNDPDALSTHTYSIGCPEFDIEKNTGELMLAVEYDLDKSTNPSNVTCVVTVSDGDLIGTATVAITINDVNDNAPFFGLPSYTFYVSQTSAHGTHLGSISATDRDAGEYGKQLVHGLSI